VKIHVVLGRAGEFSDAIEWCVKAFADEEAAKAHVLRCTQRGKELLAEHGRLRKEDAWDKIKALANEHDPNGKVDYMGRPGDSYSYETIDLEGAP
jgi:hypothetical protein